MPVRLDINFSSGRIRDETPFSWFVSWSRQCGSAKTIATLYVTDSFSEVLYYLKKCLSMNSIEMLQNIHEKT